METSQKKPLILILRQEVYEVSRSDAHKFTVDTVVFLASAARINSGQTV